MYKNNKDIGWEKPKGNGENGSYDDSLIKSKINEIDKELKQLKEDIENDENEVGNFATEDFVRNEIEKAQLDGGDVDLSGLATKDELNAKADVEDIPTKVSQLENDSNYLTSIPSEYITETELNDKGYLTEHQDISGKVDKEDGKGLISLSEIERLKNVDNYTHPSTHNATMITEDKNHRFVTDEEKALWNNKEEKNHTHKELHEHANKDILNDITSDKIDEWDNKSEFNGDYNSLTNKPTIPSIEGLATETYVQNKIAEAQLSGEEVDLSGYATKDDLHEHTNKNILDNITSEKVNDWDNKSEFDGDYNSLTNKPTIPSIEGLATKDYVENEINKKINVDLISNPISGTVLTLTNDRYQMAEIVDGTTIVLPVVETYTEIHLFFTTTSDITIIMPNGIKYQKIPTIIADKTYEFIFTYTNVGINWVFGYIEYIN